MTQEVGQARVPTTRFPLTESPNLWESRVKAMIGVEKKRVPLLFYQVYMGGHWLVSEDHTVNAGSKQNNAAQIWMEATQENSNNNYQLCSSQIYSILTAI